MEDSAGVVWVAVAASMAVAEWAEVSTVVAEWVVAEWVVEVMAVAAAEAVAIDNVFTGLCNRYRNRL